MRLTMIDLLVTSSIVSTSDDMNVDSVELLPTFFIVVLSSALLLLLCCKNGNSSSRTDVEPRFNRRTSVGSILMFLLGSGSVGCMLIFSHPYQIFIDICLVCW